MPEAGSGDMEVRYLPRTIPDELLPRLSLVQNIGTGQGLGDGVTFQQFECQPTAVGPVGFILEARSERGRRLLHALLLGEIEAAGTLATGDRQHARLELRYTLLDNGHDRHHRAAKLTAQALRVQQDACWTVR